MANFKEHIFFLKSSIATQNFQIQIKVISQLVHFIDQSNDKKRAIQDLLRTNIAYFLIDIISSQLSILLPTLKLIRHLIKDADFRNYEFINILKNILRVLVMFVQKNKIEKYKLDFFDIVNNLDVILKRYLLKPPETKDEDLQSVFLCLLKFVELVNCEECISISIKNLTIEIYLHSLCLIETHACIFKNFQLIMKVFNLADTFLNYLLEKYRKDASELWLFKIIEILYRLLRSCNESDGLQVKCFENIFYGRMSFVLEQVMMMLNSLNSNTEIFKFCISMLNIILWSPFFSENFCSKILKKTIKLNAHSIMFILSKSSRKTRKHTQYSMRIFLTSLVVHSCGSSIKNHLILDTFLQSRLPSSLIDLTPREVVQNSKPLILLYGCSFFKQQLRSSINAYKVLENLAIVLQNTENNEDIWKILRIFAYFSNYAYLSALEYAGVQKISENLLEKASELSSNNEILFPANKYMIFFAERFAPNTKISNSMILSYMSQEPSDASPKIGQIISSTNILPFISSTDHNQVVNAVRILQKKHLKEDDLDFIVKQCLCHLKSQEIIIEGALCLINKNVAIISACSVTKILTVTIAFLKAKQKAPKYSKLCYFLMMETCVNLVRFATNLPYVEKE